MKFPYISALPIVAEVLSEVKRLIKTVPYTEEDCYLWAIDVARLIGGNNYDDDTCTIAIKRNSGKLPRNFYLVDHIEFRSEDPLNAIEPVRPSEGVALPIQIYSAIMRPADGNTQKFCTSACLKRSRKAELNYTIKVPPGIIRTSFPSGFVCINYLKIPMDEDGIVQIQDEANGIMATKSYIKYMLVHESWMMQEMRQDVYLDIKNEWEDWLRLAQQQQKAFDPSHTDFKAIEQDQRYRIFNYKRQ